MSTVNNPFPYFPDAGTNGYIYIGSANQDAQTNPIVAYRDAELTAPWSQPIRTLNGYAAYQGAKAGIFLGVSEFSITVKDSNGVIVLNDNAAQRFLNYDDLTSATSIIVTARDEAEAAATAAALSEAAAETAQAEAESARDAANSAAVAAQQYYPGARDYVPRGLTSVAITAAGSGGTNGTYTCPLTGDNLSVDAYATVVVTGGAVTSVSVAAPGLYIGASPTAGLVDVSSITGLTGATLTPTIGYLKTSGNTWLTDTDPASAYLSLFRNESNVAVEIDAQFDPMSAGAAADAADRAETVSQYAVEWVRQGSAVAVLSTGTVYNPVTGAGSANANYKALTMTLTGTELDVRASARVSGTGNALACYYDASNVFISSQFVGNNTSPIVYSAQALTPPANARKVIICGLISNGTINIDVLTPRPLATTQTNAGFGMAAATGLASWTDSGATIVPGAFISNFGVATSVGGYQYLDYTITANDIAFRATGTENGTGTQLACYVDQNGELTGTQFTGTGSNVAYTNQVLTIPAGTAKIRVCGISSASLSLSVLKIPATAGADITTAKADGARGQAAATSLDAWVSSGATVVPGFYINAAGAPVALGGYQYLEYTLDGTESGFEATGITQGGATQLANYINASGNSIGTQFTGTGSVVYFTDQILTVPTGTVKIRLCGTQSGPLALQVKKVLPNAGALIQSGSGNTNVSVFGDSMAQMLAPVLGGLYPDRLTYNMGLGGQVTQQVAARMGAIPVTTSAQITLPTSGSVSVTPSIDLLFIFGRTSAYSCRVLVLGVECNLVCAASTGAYTLQPVVAPASPLVIPAGTNITVITGSVPTTDPSAAPLLKSLLSGTVIVRTSRNDTGTITTAGGRTTILGYLQAIYTQVEAYKGNLMIMTGTNGTYDMPISSGLPGAAVADAASSDLRLSSIATFNAQINAAFPDCAIDPQANHVMRGGSTNRTPVSTTYAVLNSTVLQSDGLHENSSVGQPQTAAFVKAIMTARGY